MSFYLLLKILYKHFYPKFPQLKLFYQILNVNQSFPQIFLSKNLKKTTRISRSSLQIIDCKLLASRYDSIHLWSTLLHRVPKFSYFFNVNLQWKLEFLLNLMVPFSFDIIDCFMFFHAYIEEVAYF